MLDIVSIREKFPALQPHFGARAPVFLDGPGGTQVPLRVAQVVSAYLTTHNANHGGVFATSRQSDLILEQARERVAHFLNAPSADEIIFGPNMTTLTFHLSRAIGKTLRPGDEVMVTRLDHDANISPWVLAARDAGVTVRHVDIDPGDCTLDLDDFRRCLGPCTRLVALACASNAVGTLNDVGELCRLSHQAGALVFLDAVHYAPHGPIDVRAWNCDFLTCSAYKFFGPHVGILWGRGELLRQLPVYKLRPAPESLPYRWMTGTQNHEGLAGLAEAIAYTADIGSSASTAAEKEASRRTDWRSRILAGMNAVREYETDLCRGLLEALRERPWIKVWGIADPARVDSRVPTVSITMRDHSPRQIAEHLAERGIYAWDGNMYALELTERLGLQDSGGFLRLGLVHYNTSEEIGRLLEALDEFAPLSAQ